MRLNYKFEKAQAPTAQDDRPSLKWSSIFSLFRKPVLDAGNSVCAGREVPTFRPGQPWHVSKVSLEDQMLLVETTDSEGKTGNLEFDVDDLKLIQYISQRDPHDERRTLYAEIRPVQRDVIFGQPNRIVYLGEITRSQFPALKTELDAAKVHSVWYPTERSEKATDLLPDHWGPQYI